MTKIIGHGKRKRRYQARGLPDRFVGWVEFDRDPDTGKRRRVTREFARAADRDAWLVEQLQEAKHEQSLQRLQRRQRLTVGDLLDRYVTHNGGAKPWSPRHAARTRQVTTTDLAPLRNLEARKLRPSTLERWYGERMAAGTAANTVRLSRVALQAAYNLAIRDRLISDGYNPAALSQLTVKRNPPRFLDRDQAHVFLEACRRCKYGTLYAVATLLALRPGEAIGLHWPDVDWSEPAIDIERNVQFSDGRYHVRPPKADSRRRIPLPGPIVDLLREWRASLEDERIASVVMFPNTSGGYLYETMLNRHLADLLESAGLPRIPFYGLRHTGATVMLAMDIPVSTIKEVMGHSNISVTLGYAHVTAPLRREVASKMEEFIASNRALGGTGGGSG